MVIALAVHHKVALVVAAGHQCHVAHVDGGPEQGVGGVHLRSVPRVLHAAGPLAAVGLLANGTQVAAHAYQCAGQAPGLRGLAHHFHGVALAHAAHIQRHLRVGQVHGLGLLVDHYIVDVAVLGCGFQLLLSGQGVVGLVLVALGGLTVVVPDVQHAAHGHVQLAVCGVVHLLSQLQHGQDAVIHLHGGFAGVVVDSFHIHHAVVVVVDVVQLVVRDQVSVQGFHLLSELFLALAVGDHLGDGVEHIIEDGAVAGQLLLGLGGTAGQHTQTEHRRQQSGGEAVEQGGFHRVWFSFAAVKAVCSSCRWASRSPNTQLRLAGVTTALRGMFTCACFIRSSRVSTSLSLKLASTRADG